MVRVVFSYGPSCLSIQADMSRSELSAGRVVWYPFIHPTQPTRELPSQSQMYCAMYCTVVETGEDL